MMTDSPTEPIDYEKLVRHLNRAQRLSSTGSWEWDIATNEIIWSAQIFRMFGLAPHAFTPTYPAFLERVHPDDRSFVAARVQQAISGLEDYDIDHRIIRSDGEIRIVHEQGEVEYDRAGRPIRMIGAVHDVTEVRAAALASKRSEEMLATMLTISPEAIVVTDPRARILAFSAGAEMIFGYKAEEVVGGRVEQLIPTRFRRSHQGHVERFAAGTAPSLRMHERSQIVGLRKNGEEFIAEASLARLETADGFAFTTIVRDLSEQKAAEQRLIEAREQAEKASLAKSTFLANMSHEIRTPLNGVLGVAGALARSGLNARQLEMVKLVESSGRALQGLLSDILDLAKADSGRMSVRAEPFDLGGVVRDTFALFGASAAEKGVDLVMRIDETCSGAFCGDDLKIRQVLSNLLSNAVKFTDHGEVRLSVSMIPTGAGPDHVRFVVEDTGIGFAPDVAATLFERFEQADGSITRRFGGTGLGLAISKSLVSLMGGAISAASTPGCGAKFTFEVPLMRAEAIVTPDSPSAIARAASTMQPMRILLAEDHAVNRLAVEFILETLPVELTSVENGQLALEAYGRGQFDLVFMDMQMPVMDGLTAIRAIRAFETAQGRARTPICVLTANAMAEHRDCAVEAGADAFLTKPIDANALISLVLGFAAEATE